MLNTFGLLIKDKYGSKIRLYQARSGQIYISFGPGIPLSYEGLIKGGLESWLYDIEDFDAEKYNEYYAKDINNKNDK